MALPLIPPAARRPRSGNAGEDRARADQVADLSPLLGAPLAKARRLGRFTLGPSAPTKIPHGQGRELVGWMATRPSGPAHVVETSADRDLLVIYADDDVSVDVWVW